MILCSVESSEVDLSDFQDAEDGTNVPSDNDAGQPAEADAAPQQQGAGRFQYQNSKLKMIVFCISLFLTFLLFLYQIIENDQAADNSKKKLVITEEHFQRVTQALVMRLRQHEESVMKDGTSFLDYLP